MKKEIIFLSLLAILGSISCFGQFSSLGSTNLQHLSTKGYDAGSGSIINSRIFSRPGTNGLQYNDWVLGTESNHPMSFRTNGITQMRLNTIGDFGVGYHSLYDYDSTSYATNNTILAKIHALGVGFMSLTYRSYYPIRSAILGQATSVSETQNNVGVVGTTDGSATDDAFNVGVAGIGSTSATATGNVMNFFGDVNTSTSGGVYGLYTNQTQNNDTGDVYGINSNSINNGVSGTSYGLKSSTYTSGTGDVYGGFQYVTGNTGIVFGARNSANRLGSTGTGVAYGTYNSAYSNNTAAYGTYNRASSTSSSAYGNYNELNGTGSFIYGEYNKIVYGGGGNGYGVHSNVTSGTTAADTWLYGIYSSASNSSTSVNQRRAYGGYFYGYSANTSYGYGIYAFGNTYGAYNESTSSGTGSYNKGYVGSFSDGSYAGAWNGVSGGTQTYGSINYGGTYGLYAQGSTYAGYFSGSTYASGNVGGATKTFKIDHPLDPENKYLYHVSVESPDMTNLYNGNITTDANGDATVILPSYFNALNKDFRYQLTTVGQFAQVMVATEIAGNQFTIKSDKPNVKISWQVTGIRQDAYANANRVVAEVDKKGNEKGTYIHPTAFGKSASMGETFAFDDKNRLDAVQMRANAAEAKAENEAHKPPKETSATVAPIIQAAPTPQRATPYGPITYPIKQKEN